MKHRFGSGSIDSPAAIEERLLVRNQGFSCSMWMGSKDGNPFMNSN